MATVSNAGAGMSFSNAQQGTRGMSASDWIRLQRLRGARANGYSNASTSGVLSTYIPSSTNPNPIFNKDVVPPQPSQLEIHNINGAINVFPVVGTSKIRRPASNWTDYVASQTADYVLSGQSALHKTSVVNKQYKLCTCTNQPTTLSTKTGICTKCNQTTHVRIM
jgi:hypothetical protein